MKQITEMAVTPTELTVSPREIVGHTAVHQLLEDSTIRMSPCRVFSDDKGGDRGSQSQ